VGRRKWGRARDLRWDLYSSGSGIGDAVRVEKFGSKEINAFSGIRRAYDDGSETMLQLNGEETWGRQRGGGVSGRRIDTCQRWIDAEEILNR
jgi:hypothetical protein